MGVCPAKSDAAAPVVEHEDHLGQAESLHEALDILEVVVIGVVDGRLVRLAHADEVRRNRASHLGDVGSDVPPEIVGHWVSVEENNRIAFPLLDVVHASAMDLDEAGFKGEGGADRGHPARGVCRPRTSGPKAGGELLSCSNSPILLADV